MSRSNCMWCRSIIVCIYVLWQLWHCFVRMQHTHTWTLLHGLDPRKNTTDGRKDDRGERGTKVTTKPGCDDSGFQVAQNVSMASTCTEVKCLWRSRIHRKICCAMCSKTNERTHLTYSSADGHRAHINTPIRATVQRSILECNYVIGKL